MSVGAPAPRAVLVFDVDETPGRRPLAETIRAAGYEPVAVGDVDELISLHTSREALVSVIAFQALWPVPQSAIRTLRQRAPGLRLIVAHEPDSARMQLGRRLWTVNLIDYWIPQYTPPHEMRPLLRQAYTDALIESATRHRHRPAARGGDRSWGLLDLLKSVGQALNNERQLEGLVRRLRLRLHEVIEFQLMQILAVNGPSPRLFSLPTVRLDYGMIWDMAGLLCSSALPFLDEPVSIDDLEVIHTPPLSAADEEEDSRSNQRPPQQIIHPMIVHGELAGCLGLVLPPDTRAPHDQRLAIEILANQLGSALVNVERRGLAEATSTVDQLTGLPNARYLGEVLPRELQRARRYKTPVSVAIFDVDRLRDVNQRFGYVVGDAVLVGVGSRLDGLRRETDQLLRYGGKKFILVLPETGPSEAAIAIERIRATLKSKPAFASDRVGPIQVSCTVGIASYPACPASSAAELISVAEQALRSAKLAGPDQVCIAAGAAPHPLQPAKPDSAELRRFPRIDAELRVRYVELPDFEGQLTSATTLNVNAGGIAVDDGSRRLRKHGYALVFVEDAQAPVLSQVVWTRDERNRRRAGLRFLRAEDFGKRVEKTRKIKAEPHALVITDSARTWDLVQRTLIAARYRMRLVRKEEDIPTAGQLARYAVLVVGESALRRWVGPQLEQLRSQLGRPGRVVVVNESDDRDKALATISAHRVEHLVSIDETSDAELFATLNKLLLGEYFGIQKYLRWGVAPTSWSLDETRDKQAVLEEIRHIAHEVYCHPRIADLLITAVEEMILIASDDGSGGQAAYPITVECATDGRLFAVAVRDEQGRLLHDQLHRGLASALDRGSNDSTAGDRPGDLGLQVMLSCLSHLAVNVEPGRRSEIIGIVDLRKSVREFRQLVPALGVFVADEKSKEEG